ncbi:MAG: hypothetical protein WC455_10530 [Dehalococcoidia bacterium]|jgi:hypothetical protein
MTRKIGCDHGDGDAVMCTRPTSCLMHEHVCRCCGNRWSMEEKFTNRFTPFRAKSNEKE